MDYQLSLDDQDLNYFEENVENDLIDDLGDWDQLYCPEEDDSMELLNNHDYNLNSPLIIDDLEQLNDYIKSGIHPRDKRKIHEFSSIKKFLELTNGAMKLLDPVEIQPLIARNRNRIINLDKYIKLGNQLNERVDKSSEVLRAFIKGWIKKDDIVDQIQLNKRWNDVPELGKCWLESFFHYYNIILVMNRTGIYEEKELQKRISIKEVLIGKEKAILYNGKSLGHWVIFKNYAYSYSDNIIYDRNTLLMVKDVLISRFQTLLSMKLSRYETEYTEKDIETLMKIYRLGDDVLIRSGNRGYKGIKMVEPICNLRMVDIARLSRPLIPPFPNFENHIKTSCDELREMGIEIVDLKDEILRIENLDLLLTVYGSFRHWGHPYIDYLEGLRKLEEQVNLDLNVDRNYASILASDLAYKVLKKMFFEKKKWFVDLKKLDKKNKMYSHVKYNTWPTQGVIDDFGDHWHELPLTKCFEIPDMIDPSTIYSDKSHSLNRSEVLSHIQSKPNQPIPTRRVLKTLLEKPATVWPEFLQKVNDEGLDWESLVIGLKAKERELKEIGRFFSLMSWELREYFVITEYLIKQHFVPLFKGLTMADDLQTVIKKMLDVSAGQGTDDYEYVTLANNIDYEKWNNYQRIESNEEIFGVMGKFLGYPKLISRTHEFFQKSLIYYNLRPDLMHVIGRTAFNTTDKKVCWEGQKGGLEGLRQKGWSVVNLLMIERESKVRNTLVKVLAQGDNQTITTHYKTETYRTQDELSDHIRRMVENNNVIMQNIIEGTKKLGLKINEDETMQSADYINYGKVPIIRGVIRGLHTKRWSRVNFTNNDQVPNQTSILSSVSTNSLTVSHFSNTPLDAMVGHLVFGNFGLLMLDFHNPALRTAPLNLVKRKELYNSAEYIVLNLYLDPSLGGIGGTSLTRFLVRMFPDPVSESLSFWRLIYENTKEDWLKRLAIAAGNPKLSLFKPNDLDKLIENPEGLNIPRGISANNMIKEQVKTNIIQNAGYINNQIIRDAAKNCLVEQSKLFNWLRTIRPLFPRFISQFANATYYGITMSLMGLFTNSKTIRSTYRKNYSKELDNIIIKSELISISSLLSIISRGRTCVTNNMIWKCSSTQADKLREISWGQRVLGMTIPHPIEMFEGLNIMEKQCNYCSSDDLEYASSYITVMCPKGIPRKADKKGPYNPYLGSKTKESTSVLQPWEKETKIPVIKRASELRKAISWFIAEESNLAKSIFNNLRSLTGENWEQFIEGFKRTGSALHRFTCSRVSAGGYTANAPGKICWTITTTDTMCNLGDQNYDFMYQASMIYAQSHCIESVQSSDISILYHYHIKCSDCVREIEEPTLESEWIYEPLDVSDTLNRWRPDKMEKWGEEKRKIHVTDDSKLWKSLNTYQQSTEIGKTIGFVYTDMALSKHKTMEDRSLFPVSIRNKVHPRSFLKGIITGIKLASSLQLTHRRNIIILKRPVMALIGTMYYSIEILSEDSTFLSFISNGPLYNELCIFPHKIPSSYPLNHKDVGLMARNYLKNIMPDVVKRNYNEPNWVFSDLRSPSMIGSYALSVETSKILIKREIGKEDKNKISELQHLYVAIMSDDQKEREATEKLISSLYTNLRFCNEEIRHAAKFGDHSLLSGQDNNIIADWKMEYICDIQIYRVYMDKPDASDTKTLPFEVPYRSNPLISGLRVNQLATGAHYKIRGIINNLGIKFRDLICGGDGSGGITSCLMRENPLSRSIFNSLLILDGIPLHGNRPSPPSAIIELGNLSENCVNLYDVWKEPSDLSWDETWMYFRRVKVKFNLRVDLIVLDMEVINDDVSKSIIHNLNKNLGYLLESGGTVIFKSYVSKLLNQSLSIIDKIGSVFQKVLCTQTSLSSTNTSEIYVIFLNYQPGLRVQTYSNKKMLLEELKKTYVFRSQESEFERALRFRNEDLKIGLPERLVSNFNIELSTLLNISGLDGVTTALLSDSQILDAMSGIELGYIIMILLSEHYINTTKIYKNRPPDLLSDQDIKRLFSTLVGISLWVSWMSGRIELYKLCDDLINEGGTLYHYQVQGNVSWNFVTGKLNNENKRKKHIDIRSKMAHMGNWIRVLTRKYQNGELKFREKSVNQILTSVNKKLSLNHMIRHSGLKNVF